MLRFQKFFYVRQISLVPTPTCAFESALMFNYGVASNFIQTLLTFSLQMFALNIFWVTLNKRSVSEPYEPICYIVPSYSICT